MFNKMQHYKLFSVILATEIFINIMNHNSNPYFVLLLEKIQKIIPNVMFIWIIITYIITASISVYFIPLPLWITIPISIIIQGSRFLVVFMNFLNNPALSKSDIPGKIALFATFLALTELLFAMIDRNSHWNENVTIYIFISTIILFGYFLEIHFIKSGEMVLEQRKQEISELELKKNVLNHHKHLE
jgi:hypothetical protein